MKSAFQKVCTLGGKCFNLVAPTLGRVTPFVQKTVAAHGEMQRLTLDVSIVRSNARTFRAILRRLDNYQKSAGVKICSLKDGFDILTTYDTLITQFKPIEGLSEVFGQESITGKVGAGSSEVFRRFYPDWYRAELQKFNSLMQATLANITLEITTVHAHLQHAKSLPHKAQQKLIQKLKSFPCLEFRQPTTTTTTTKTEFSGIHGKRKKKSKVKRGVRGGLYYVTKSGQRRYVKRR